MTIEAAEELLSSLKELYATKEYSDAVITSATAQHPVHKAVICPRSQYFAAECRREAGNARSESSQKCVIDLSNDDPQAVEMIVQYFYYLDYPAPSPTKASSTGEHQDEPKTNGDHVNGDHINGDHVNGEAQEGQAEPAEATINGHDGGPSPNAAEEQPAAAEPGASLGSALDAQPAAAPAPAPETVPDELVDIPEYSSSARKIKSKKMKKKMKRAASVCQEHPPAVEDAEPKSNGNGYAHAHVAEASLAEGGCDTPTETVTSQDHEKPEPDPLSSWKSAPTATAECAPGARVDANVTTPTAPPAAAVSATSAPASTTCTTTNAVTLAVHAKVYELSKKYLIGGLRALALEKFSAEAVGRWATEEFLEAARVVYASSSPPFSNPFSSTAVSGDVGGGSSNGGAEAEDRKMKDLVAEIVYRHPELLDRPQAQSLELALDVLMRVRKFNGFPGAGGARAVCEV